MLIGLCTMELIFPMARSLKDKRSILKSLTEKSKNKFNIAIAETDKNDIWKSSTISVVTVSNQRKQIDRLFTKYINFVDDFDELQLRDYNIELL